jgi:hypothetical protein
MTNQSSRFIPPAGWIENLCRAAGGLSVKYSGMNWRYEEYIAAQVAEWTKNEMTKAFLEWLQDHARLPDYSLDDRLRLSGELREYLSPLDKSDAADAARLRWMLKGDNGFLMDRQCIWGSEVDKVRREIDKKIAMEEKASE